jgi:hypothetical protein
VYASKNRKFQTAWTSCLPSSEGRFDRCIRKPPIEMSLKNLWHHRKVADGSAKACWVCYKPSTSVLITPDNKVATL